MRAFPVSLRSFIQTHIDLVVRAEDVEGRAATRQRAGRSGRVERERRDGKISAGMDEGEGERERETMGSSRFAGDQKRERENKKGT